MKACVFAGTFDPFSKGHEYIVDKCLDLFDEVVIAIGVNVDKKPMFTLDERKQIILAKYSENKRVRVCSFEGMLVDFMRKENIIHTVRGIRDEGDYKYESVMAKYNEDLFPDVVSIFIPTPNELSYISSTAVRNIIELNSDFSKYLPKESVKVVKDIIKSKKK